MTHLALINVVGLTQRLIGDEMPFLQSWIQTRNLSQIEPMLPAVTCSVQTTYLTGVWPQDHGIVGNGWYFRDECEVKFWRQSNKLVQATSIWDHARQKDPKFTCANMFWWYNMYSTVDYSVTPRPQYRANGLKIPDCYSHPTTLRDRLQADLGTFPLFHFWGPTTSIKSSRWIAEASLKVWDWHKPTLLLVYLPHLDYCLQKFGNNHDKVVSDLREIDQVLSHLISELEHREIVVNLISEYGITDVTQPIHLNRIFRKHQWLAIREENGLELLDAGQSKVFALADHQVAQIYINDHSQKQKVKKILEKTPGIAYVLDQEKKTFHLDHSRSGELIAVASPDHWFTYYYWLQDSRAPDFARTVDIHRKPGYDPVEMFFDPKKKLLMPRIIWKLLMKKLGFRTLMNFIPLDASLVKGSHGQVDLDDHDKPIFITSMPLHHPLKPTEIHDLILSQVFND